jgi:ATP-binding cassette subfamily B protein
MADRPPGRQGSPSSLPSHGPAGKGRTRIEKARDPRSALRRLLAYLHPYRGQLVVVFGLVVVSSLLDLMGPYLIGVAIDGAIAGGDPDGLLRILLLMLGVYVLLWLIQLGQGVIVATAAQRAMRVLRRDLFEHLQTLSLRFFDKRPHGELMSRLTNDLDAISRVLSQNVTQLFGGLLHLVGIVVAMFALNFWLALASMLILPLMLVFVGFVGRRTRGGFRGYQARVGELNGQLEEMFSGQRVIVAFGRQARVLEEFDRANQAVRDAGISAFTYAMLVPPLMGIFSNANIAVLAGLGGWMILRGLASVGTIATFYNYSRSFARPLRQLGDLYNQVQSALAGAERVFQVIDEQAELTDAPDAVVLDDVRGEVVFDHVDFGYEPAVPVIRDVSLAAAPGQTVALVGPTGAGKTTIVNLLTRFYDVDGGAIRIDGHDVRRVQKASLRRQLGIVLQDTFLFAGSVMDNIRYGRLDATDEEVVAAAGIANADRFIRRLPQGYETELSERGSNLSEGQRQLLAIARAVLADPGILVLDEATSSVDTRTEVRIQEAMLRLMEGRTSFVIAHRLSTIRDADVILVIDEGRVVERGSHDELLARRGSYHRLYTSQFKGTAGASAA